MEDFRRKLQEAVNENHRLSRQLDHDIAYQNEWAIKVLPLIRKKAGLEVMLECAEVHLQGFRRRSAHENEMARLEKEMREIRREHAALDGKTFVDDADVRNTPPAKSTEHAQAEIEVANLKEELAGIEEKITTEEEAI